MGAEYKVMKRGHKQTKCNKIVLSDSNLGAFDYVSHAPQFGSAIITHMYV